MVKAHFDNIRQHILAELERATAKIVVAIYWFTDEELFHKLLEKGKQDCKSN
jgi:hypothetical protein